MVTDWSHGFGEGSAVITSLQAGVMYPQLVRRALNKPWRSAVPLTEVVLDARHATQLPHRGGFGTSQLSADCWVGRT